MKSAGPHDDRLWRESETTPWFRFMSPLRYVVFLLILIIVLVGLWYLIAPSRQWYNKEELPLIRADQAHYKVKVAHQGVPGVKHQDKLVYGRIRADENGPVAEHILPEPEVPRVHLSESDAPLKMVEQYAPEDQDPDTKVELSEKEEDTKVSTIASIEDLLDESTEEKESTEGKESTQEKETPEAKERVFMQLGSLKSYELAEAEWKRLSKKHPDILGGLEPLIQKVDLGEEQGIYYRLRAGPFDGITKVTEACAHLEAQKVDCVVVR